MTSSPRPRSRPLFAAWLAAEMRRRGYDLDQRGEQARFARDADLSPGIVSRLLRASADPDIKTCGALARVLGYTTTRVLAAAGLIPDAEDDAPPAPRPLTPRDHIAALVGDDPDAQAAVITLLRALGKWAPKP
ncbi:helix-turn-helix DNA-binding domain protein [Streptomyces phage Cumberbatch]|uniref:Helix-turn-helix DNA binding domain protein n=1 Tax=Streptomyces phage Cumberbatch TaxID=2736271 RepID=A0A6M9Z7I5_9CAUD|nr:helix-turn-helix DNA-binding domain protein [Streptomyces phage Cumberbatch]QKN87674.1 helix-turn-helix DNA-binding domain protein [Streptomyces phage Cumberbatch]